MDSEAIATIVLRGTLAEWHRLRDAAAADSAVLARLLSACKARGRLPDFQENAEPFRCWLAYAESVMARDVDGTVLQEVYADARWFIHTASCAKLASTMADGVKKRFR